MDNDPAGEKATDFFIDNGNADVWTANGFCEGFGDLNEWLVATKNSGKNRMVPNFRNTLA